MFVGRVGPVDRRSDGERSRRPREFEYIRYETIDDGRIAAITLDRPKQRNAQLAAVQSRRRKRQPVGAQARRP